MIPADVPPTRILVVDDGRVEVAKILQETRAMKESVGRPQIAIIGHVDHSKSSLVAALASIGVERFTAPIGSTPAPVPDPQIPFRQMAVIDNDGFPTSTDPRGGKRDRKKHRPAWRR